MSEQNKSDFVVRTMVPADAEKLIGLVRKCYGDGYPNKMLYQPTAIVEALRDGLMHSVIALDPEGDIIGHCALTFDDKDAPLPEAGKMIVDPDRRGQHIANKLAEHRKAVAIDNALVGYWSECVTNHPFSQDEIIMSGGIETGVFLAMFGPGFQMAGVNNVTDVRLSLLAFYISLNSQTKGTIYLPGEYARFTRELSQSLGLERQILPEAACEPKASVLNHIVSTDAQFAQINVATVGDDLGQKVEAILNQPSTQGIEIFHLDLPLNHPNAIAAIPALESLGFFWAAWLPNYTASGDILRLQKVEATINPDEIVCARPNGEKVKQHILAERQRIQFKTQ